jgi:hypothetical protein
VAERPVALPPIGGSDVVPGDPRECREHALRCAELATTAKTERLKMLFLNLSMSWERLALSLEHGLGRVEEVEAAWSDVYKSLAETRRLFNSPNWKK